MTIENQEVNLTDITPSWFYQKFEWNKISKLCNVLAWQGLVKHDEDTLSEHAISICIAIPYSEPTTGPLFANTYLANIADYLVRGHVYDKIYVNGDSIMVCGADDDKDENGNVRQYQVSFSFYRYMDGISFIYFGFPNYSSKGKSMGMSSEDIKKFIATSEQLAVGIAHTTFVNGLFATIGGK